jgi:sugar lactone lactonase YvrE
LFGLAVFATSAALGAEIHCEGVLGNSGEQGATLVRFDEQPTRGMGVAYDTFGTLWDRAGKGRLNRYALDGRLLASYRLPNRDDRSDQLAIAGGQIVLLIGKQIYTVDVNAAADSEAKALKIEAECISSNALKGRLAIAAKDGTISLLDPASGALEKVATVNLKGLSEIELDADANIYIHADGKIHKLAGGKLVTDGWPKPSPGERPQLIDGHWFGHAWHGTIKRFDADLQPAPGVVLGGASGSFIGHLAQNSELSNARGLALINPKLYATSGIGCVLQLASWDPEARKMELIRRLGALPTVSGLGLDKEGNVWCFAGRWEWNDAPDTPLRDCVNGPEFPGIAQAVMLDSDIMVTPGRLWGKPSIFAGKLDGEIKVYRYEKEFDLQKDPACTAAYKKDGKWILLNVSPKGTAQAHEIAANGEWRANLGAVTLQTASPMKEWTSLAMKGDTLLAAADGNVIEFARDGVNWKETRRWSSWEGDAASKFGARVWICADAGRLWVSDTERQRVLAFDLASGKSIATFGTTDKAGTSLTDLTRPQVIMARGTRAVVHDSGNQRLMKLRLGAE